MELRYKRQTIYTGEPGELVFCAVGDLNGDGVPEIFSGSRIPTEELYWIGRNAAGVWERHIMDTGFGHLGVGGNLVDVNGDGVPDFVAGPDAAHTWIYWWEQPTDPTQRWKRHLVCEMPNKNSHDQVVADLDGDGRNELYIWNQGSHGVLAVPFPDDPYKEPWPGVEMIAQGIDGEGLITADVDGDGREELIAGEHWYHAPNRKGERWRGHQFAEGFVSHRLAAADFNGDGKVEIAVSEGDASLNGRDFGRIVVFHRPDKPDRLWEPQVLNDRLVDPHSLIAEDFDGDGSPDLFVGELGDPGGHNSDHMPTHRIYLSRGDKFEELVVERGIPTHESKAMELDGKLVIVCKPYRNIKSSAPRGREIDSFHLWIPE